MQKKFIPGIMAFIAVVTLAYCQKSVKDPMVSSDAAQGLGKMKSYKGTFVVGNNAAHSISFIDAATQTVENTLTIPGSSPYYFVYLPLKDRLYVTDAGNSAVQIIDPATQEVSGHISVGSGTIMHMVGHEKKSRLWVVNNTAKTITEINANNNSIVYTLQLAYTPHDVAVNANGTKIYVSLNNGGVWQVNTYSTDLEATGDYQLLDSRPFSNNLLHLFFSAVNDKLYVADQGAGKFWALDPDHLQATATSVSVPGAHGLTLSADEAYSYIGSITEDKIYVYNNSTNTITSSITSTVTPNVHNMAVDAENDLLLATHSGAASTSVSCYSISGGALTQGATITSGLNPQAIGYYIRKLKD